MCFYDTLGAETTEFVIDQSKLQTIACTADKIAILSQLKSAGKVKSLEDLIVYETPTEDQKAKASEAGLNVHVLEEVIN